MAIILIQIKSSKEPTHKKEDVPTFDTPSFCFYCESERKTGLEPATYSLEGCRSAK